MGVVEEKYSRAVRTSHLRLKETSIGDADTLTAAGMVAAGKPVETGVRGEVRQESIDGLGTMLMRLRAEFDTTKSLMRHELANYYAAAERARVEAASCRLGPTREREILNEAEREMLTARLLILMELKSLEPAKQAVGRFGRSLSERRHLNLTPEEVARLVGAALDAWLDRKCHRCDGRGFTGGYDGPTIRCRVCRETGNRRQGVFSDRFDGQWLSEKLLAEMDRCCEAAERKMRGLLR